jgi:hypothetical protein
MGTGDAHGLIQVLCHHRRRFDQHQYLDRLSVRHGTLPVRLPTTKHRGPLLLPGGPGSDERASAVG